MHRLLVINIIGQTLPRSELFSSVNNCSFFYHTLILALSVLHYVWRVNTWSLVYFLTNLLPAYLVQKWTTQWLYSDGHFNRMHVDMNTCISSYCVVFRLASRQFLFCEVKQSVPLLCDIHGACSSVAVQSCPKTLVPNCVVMCLCCTALLTVLSTVLHPSMSSVSYLLSSVLECCASGRFFRWTLRSN